MSHEQFGTNKKDTLPAQKVIREKNKNRPAICLKSYRFLFAREQIAFTEKCLIISKLKI